jgi:uncharacterized Zn-binding protein involved in type VI secretion
MPGKPAARVSDMHVCPMVTPGTPPVPHVGGPIIPLCSPNVITGFMNQARVTDMCTCVGPPDAIAIGSPTVLVNGLMAARIGDNTVHGGVITTGFPTVLIGETPGGGGGPSGSGVTPKLLHSALAAITHPIQALQELFESAAETEARQLAERKQAKADALALLQKARDDLDTWDEATQARCKKWFGDSDESTRQLLKDRVDKVMNKLSSMSPETDFVPAEPGEEDCFAYVYPTRDDKIYLGTDFKYAPATGTDSKAGTLIHEISHYQSTGRTRDVKMADGSTAYGHSKCEKLAKEDPEKAKKNADSFEFFVEGG